MQFLGASICSTPSELDEDDASRWLLDQRTPAQEHQDPSSRAADTEFESPPRINVTPRIGEGAVASYERCPA